MPLSESSRKDAWLPLALRLALAAVFIYHGVDKIVGKGNDMGATWAYRLWERQGQLPDGLDDKLSRLPGEEEIQIKHIREKLLRVYQDENDTRPGSLIGFAGTQMAVAWGELLCGVALLLGLMTRLSAVLMIIIQIGAIISVTWAHGFAPTVGTGYEYNLVVIASCLALALTGGGFLSTDHCINVWRARRASGTRTHPPSTQTPPVTAGV